MIRLTIADDADSFVQATRDSAADDAHGERGAAMPAIIGAAIAFVIITSPER